MLSRYHHSQETNVHETLRIEDLAQGPRQVLLDRGGEKGQWKPNPGCSLPSGLSEDGPSIHAQGGSPTGQMEAWKGEATRGHPHLRIRILGL